MQGQRPGSPFPARVRARRTPHRRRAVAARRSRADRPPALRWRRPAWRRRLLHPWDLGPVVSNGSDLAATSGGNLPAVWTAGRRVGLGRRPGRINSPTGVGRRHRPPRAVSGPGRPPPAAVPAARRRRPGPRRRRDRGQARLRYGVRRAAARSCPASRGGSCPTRTWATRTPRGGRRPSRRVRRARGPAGRCRCGHGQVHQLDLPVAEADGHPVADEHGGRRDDDLAPVVDRLLVPGARTRRGGRAAARGRRSGRRGPRPARTARCRRCGRSARGCSRPSGREGGRARGGRRGSRRPPGATTGCRPRADRRHRGPADAHVERLVAALDYSRRHLRPARHAPRLVRARPVGRPPRGCGRRVGRASHRLSSAPGPWRPPPVRRVRPAPRSDAAGSCRHPPGPPRPASPARARRCPCPAPARGR